ncbi:MAG: 16S rRNA (cytosine(1402)-N(4))-methyltransferase RsmH [Rhodobiaceae bacterium]|nr:16S rRNA (cytosine(1402)-N(4))-methyltransferase RsmH [Rhodobiaceae bacterium]MCC0055667.1 16S rRNA (cytosine(1402)-N(4))-methyltransferase RsmH [Rhodobiaceae bacterium]
MMTDRGNKAAGGPVRHIPVLLPQVVEALRPVAGGVYVDGTFGAGGYTRAILEAADCRVIAIDRDPDAIAEGQALKAEFAGRLELVEAPFSEIDRVLADAGYEHCDGICLDIGVSSMQIDRAERGFSFMADGPLDMRMARSGPSAADIVNDAEPAVIANILYQLGEERQSRRIARAIAERRESEPFTRTGELASLIEQLLGRGRERIHPATRTFQALRIYVNAELQELARALSAAERVLQAGARLAVVTFHSLEDRIVKSFLAGRAETRVAVSRHMPEPVAGPEPTFRLQPKKPVLPDASEIAGNPRARSAKLRIAERTHAPARPFDAAGFSLPSVLGAGGAA